MSRTVNISKWCDNQREHEQDTEPATVERSVLDERGRSVVLDLCEFCDRVVQVVFELAKHGTPASFDKPKPKPRGQRPADNLLRRLRHLDEEIRSECDHDPDDDAYDDGHDDLVDSDKQHNDDAGAHEHVDFVDRRCNHADHGQPSLWGHRDGDVDCAVALTHASSQRVTSWERPTPASRST